MNNSQGVQIDLNAASVGVIFNNSKELLWSEAAVY